MREGGGNYLKYLKRGWNRKEGRRNKDFKKGGQAGSRGGCLRKGGVGTLLRTMYGKTANSFLGTELCRMKGLTFPKIWEMVR